MQLIKSLVFLSNFIKHFFIVDQDIDGGLQTASGWGLQVWISCEIKIKSTFWWIRTVNALMQGTQSDKTPNRIFIYHFLVFDWDPDESDETSSFEDIGIWLLKKSEIQLFPLVFSYANFSDVKEKMNLFELSSQLQVASFWLRSWWRKLNL